VEPLIEHLVERSQKEDDRQSDGMKSQLDEALTKRHETEAKLVQAEARINQLEEALRYRDDIEHKSRDYISFIEGI